MKKILGIISIGVGPLLSIGIATNAYKNKQKEAFAKEREYLSLVAPKVKENMKKFLKKRK